MHIEYMYGCINRVYNYTGANINYMYIIRWLLVESYSYSLETKAKNLLYVSSLNL